tara:strand:- start:2820 stop:3755 length:936 start_codon:yes stop_codon:yes gene_type:complete
MDKYKYLITGKYGLIGSSLARLFKKNSLQYLSISRKDLNLLDYEKTINFFKEHKFETIINCAALVGGIKANSSRQYDFLSQNMRIQNNIMDASIQSNIKNIIFLNSNCSYPANASQPFMESSYFDGAPHQSNLGYALAKRSAFLQSLPLLNQYGIKTFHPIPCSLYGPNDNFNPENSHFIAAVIKKIVDAKESKKEKIEFWGSGNPRREFMHVDDASEGIRHLLENNLSGKLINICWGEDHKIKEIIDICKKIIGFDGEVVWDTKKPDGMMRKLQSPKFLKDTGWEPKITLEDGLNNTIKWFLENRDKVRL